MTQVPFSYKSGSSGCCRKCGKPLEWRTPSVIGLENPTGCMVTAQSHIQELQKSVAKSTTYCSECSSNIRHDLILNIVLFPFNAVKFIARLFYR